MRPRPTTSGRCRRGFRRDSCAPYYRRAMRASRLIAATAAALFAPLAWPLASGRMFWFDDLANVHIPLRHLYQQALASGDSLLWTPAIFSGFYVHGEGQAGLLH